jgi:predicted thioesterase
MPLNVRISQATLESRTHEVNAIRTGLKLYESGAVKDAGRFDEDDHGLLVAVHEQEDVFRVRVEFSRDGADLAAHWCRCGVGDQGDLLCKHIVAAVYGIQGGPANSPIALGLTATAATTVDGANTAKAVRSGDLEVFATPMLVALMEEAACACLRGKLDPGQTSVGAAITVSHKAASPKGSTVTATATLQGVFGNRLEFAVSARDDVRPVADGRHTRVIVDEAGFMDKATRRGSRR